MKKTSIVQRLVSLILFSILSYIILSGLDSLASKALGHIFADLRPEAISIIFTVFIIDWLLIRAEERRSVSVRKRALFRSREAYRKAGQAIRYSGPLADELFLELYQKNPDLMKRASGEHHTVTKLFIERYDSMGNKARWGEANSHYWTILGRTLDDVEASAERAIDLYGQHINPELQSALDELATACHIACGHCNILASKVVDELDWSMMNLTFKVIHQCQTNVGLQLDNWEVN